MDAQQMQEVSRRTDVVSYSLLAEINHFHAEQASELNKVFKSFLCKQIEFHQNVSCGVVFAILVWNCRVLTRFSVYFRLFVN